MGPEGPNPRAEALSIEAQLGLGPEGPNPTGRGVERSQLWPLRAQTQWAEASRQSKRWPEAYLLMWTFPS